MSQHFFPKKYFTAGERQWHSVAYLGPVGSSSNGVHMYLKKLFFSTNVHQVPSWRMFRPSERCPASCLPWCLNRSAVPISPSKGGTHLASGPGALSGGSTARKRLHSEARWWTLIGQKTSGQLVYIRWIVKKKKYVSDGFGLRSTPPHFCKTASSVLRVCFSVRRDRRGTWFAVQQNYIMKEKWCIERK